MERINKYLSSHYSCSRREAETLIQKAWVSVNNKVLKDMGYLVQKKDQVVLAKKALEFLKAKQSIFLHKPVGYVSSQAEKNQTPAISLVVPKNFMGPGHPPLKINPKGFAPAGRLDKDSSGLLILTQNGKLAGKIISPDSRIEKEYIVRVKGALNLEKIKKLRFGLTLDGRKLKRAKVSQISRNRLCFILKEGRKQQIRRMCQSVDLQVLSLKRIRIGGLKLGSLPLGQWKFLKDESMI